MVFRHCSVGGTVYGHQAEAQDALAGSCDRGVCGGVLSVAFADGHLAGAVAARDETVLTFLRALCICNTVMPEPCVRRPALPVRPDPLAGTVTASCTRPPHPTRTRWWPQHSGWVLCCARATATGSVRDSTGQRSQHGLMRVTTELDVCGVPEHYTVVHTLQFTSTRRRMSVLAVRDGGPAMLLTKGADDVLLERLHAGARNMFWQ
jgi:magnesium-transporting ATPase (P-type)